MNSLLVRDCECWGYTASLKFKNNGLRKDAIRHIYCPECSSGIRKNDSKMVESDGWLVEYDPNLLRPMSAMVHLIRAGGSSGVFDVYVERNDSILRD